jgi:predicted nucleic acid-binding protein
LDKPLIFPKSKDRPVVITALASQAAVLLTLDRADFQRLLGAEVYGMAVRTPADFLMERRRSGAI